jgi:hypothetical protein
MSALGQNRPNFDVRAKSGFAFNCGHGFRSFSLPAALKTARSAASP